MDLPPPRVRLGAISKTLDTVVPTRAPTPSRSRRTEAAPAGWDWLNHLIAGPLLESAEPRAT
jgi:hypothetical protein